MRGWIFKLSIALHKVLAKSISFPISTKVLQTFLHSLLRSCSVRKIPLYLSVPLLRSLLEVQVRPTGDDYYLCAPPGLSFPSDLQQSQSHLKTDQHTPQTNLSTPQTLTSQQLPPTPHTPPTTSHLPNPAVATDREQVLTAYSPVELAPNLQLPQIPSQEARDLGDVTYKPLGKVGHHPIPQDLLESLLPDFNPEVQVNPNLEPFVLPPPYPHSPPMQELLESLPPEVLTLLPEEEYLQLSPPYHAAAFLLPKPSSNKISLILHLRKFNKSQQYKPPAFKLPTVYSIRLKLLQAALEEKPMFFTTWDIKNFYWALKGPIIRLATTSAQGKLQVWRLDCIPFGWDKACYLGQSVHLRVINKVPKPQDTEAAAYMDDGL